MVPAEDEKVVVVTFQQVPNEMCPYMTLCGRPKISNKSSTFNDNTVRGALEYF